MFLVVFAGKRMEMDIYFGSVLFLPFNMCVTILSLLFSCRWIVVNGQDAYSGMVGCLVLMVLIIGKPWATLFW